MLVNIMMLGLKSGPQIAAKKFWYPGRITALANLVFRLEIWGARDNGIPPRSTPAVLYKKVTILCFLYSCSHVVG